MKKSDMILAAVVLAFAGGLLLLQNWKQDTKEGVVTVYQEKEKLASYPLTKDEEINLYSTDGGVNRLIIRSGQAWIESADCPDGLCVKQGRIEREGQSVICLPHKLVITIEGGEAAKVDAVAR